LKIVFLKSWSSKAQCLESIPKLGVKRTDSTKQVASATGEGATAALVIRDYLKTVSGKKTLEKNVVAT
jgi:hypothetical protein